MSSSRCALALLASLLLLAAANAEVYGTHSPNCTALLERELDLTIPVYDRIKGLSFDIGMIHQPPFTSIDTTVVESDGSTPQSAFTGFEPDLIRKLALDSGATFHMVSVPAPGVGESWTDHAIKALKNTSLNITMLASYYFDTKERRGRGLSFTRHHMDLGFVIMTKAPSEEEKSLESVFWTFLEPFSWELWMMILAMIVFASVALEAMDEDLLDTEEIHDSKKEKGAELGYWYSIYVGFAAFSQYGGHEPRNAWGRLFVTAFRLFLLVIISSYTANLTNFIMSAPALEDAYSSMDQMISKNARICVVSGAAVDETMRVLYPAGNYVRVSSSVGGGNVSHPIIDCVRGTYPECACDAAILGQNELDVIFAVRKRCDMIQSGKVIAPFGGGFIMYTLSRAYSSFNCPLEFLQVYDYFVQKQLDNGWLGTHFDGMLEEAASHTVGTQICEVSASDTEEMELRDMAGLFILTSCIMFLAAFGFVTHRHKHGKKKKGKHAEMEARGVNGSGMASVEMDEKQGLSSAGGGGGGGNGTRRMDELERKMDKIIGMLSRMNGGQAGMAAV